MIKIILILILIVVIKIFIYNNIRNIIIRKNLREMLINIVNIFNKHNIYYWIDFGTLLGIYREKDIILGDNDIDICILDNYETHEIIKTKITFDLNKYNYIIKKLDWNAYRIYYYIGPIHFFADIYINKVKNQTIIGATGKNSNISKKLIGNIIKIKWNNIYINVPENIHETLKWRYGADYMTPKYKFKGRDSKIGIKN